MVKRKPMGSVRLKYLFKMIKASLGLMIFACGVYLLVRANSGAAPWDVLCIGIAVKTGTLYGTVSIGISVILILIDVFLLKEKIGVGTILDALVVGKTVDLLNYLDPVPLMQGSVFPKVCVLIAGFFLEAIGQYVYMKEALGYGPRDTLQIGLGKLMKKIPIGFVNTIILAVVLILGMLLGGPAGIGSLIAPFGIGVAQQTVFRVMKFEPKDVVNENIMETWRRLCRSLPPDAVQK